MKVILRVNERGEKRDCCMCGETFSTGGIYGVIEKYVNDLTFDEGYICGKCFEDYVKWGKGNYKPFDMHTYAQSWLVCLEDPDICKNKKERKKLATLGDFSEKPVICPTVQQCEKTFKAYRYYRKGRKYGKLR